MDFAPYLARLALLLPLLCALIAGGLWVAKRCGLGTGQGLAHGLGDRFARALARHDATPPPPRAARVTQTLALGPGARLAVVEFADRRLLLALGKGGIATLADTPLAPAAPIAALRPLRAADAR